MRNKMKNYITPKFIIAAAILGASIFSTVSANALVVRDHRGACGPLVANCTDHRGPLGPVVVVPPPPMPDPGPIVVNQPPQVPPPEPPHHPRFPHWPPIIVDTPDDEYGISCGEGRQIVRQHGFRRVRPIDCSGDIFKYSSDSRRYGPATVLVNMDGEIVDVRRIIFN
jgi:hypothetical protein